MLNLQKITRGVVAAVFGRRLNSSSVPQFARTTLEKADAKDIKENTPSRSQSKIPKNPLVAAAFASLKVENLDEISANQTDNIVLTGIDERISNAKTINGLLAIAEGGNQISRIHALKVVSILAEWNAASRVRLSEFENDSRFLKLCRILGKNVMKVNNQNNNTKKISGFRTDDLNTVLGVTGDDEAAKLISGISLPQMVKVMSTLAQKKRRSTPLLRSLAYNISSKPDQIDLKQCGDLLYAMTILNFPDPVLISRICSDFQNGLIKNEDKSAVVGSVLTSLGLLKYRDSDLLEILSNWILKYQNICRPQDTSALFLTLAVLNYTTTNSRELKNTLSQLLTKEDFNKSSDWLNHVWSLVVLEMSSPDQIESVLNKDFIEQLTMERGGELNPSIKMKLLNINAASKFLLSGYKGSTISIEDSLFSLPLVHNKSKQTLIAGMLDALKSLLSSPNHLRTNYDTNMGFVIDAECVLDSKSNPLPVDSQQEGATRVAIMALDFHDMCQGNHQIPNGVIAFAFKLLEKNGYKILPVPHIEFNSSEKLLKRVQYLEGKLKEIVNTRN